MLLNPDLITNPKFPITVVPTEHQTMAWSTMSHPNGNILNDCQIEDKKLLGYEDQSENDSESAWTRDDIIKQSRKVIPRPSTIRGWGFLGVLLIATSALSGTLGYLFKQGCTEKECILMTSSPCKFFFSTVLLISN